MEGGRERESKGGRERGRREGERESAREGGREGERGREGRICSSPTSLGDFRAIDSSSTGILLEITFVDKMHNIGIRARLPM